MRFTNSTAYRATGGTPVKLNAELPVRWRGGCATAISVQPGRITCALHRADQDTNEVYELYSVPATGGAPVKLNTELPSGGNTWYVYFQFSPDGSRVLYRADQDTNEVYELYSVRAAGGTPVKLNAELTFRWRGVAVEHGFQFSPDGSRVLYRADQDTDNVFELYSVPATGGTPVKLNSALTFRWRCGLGADFQFSPDGSRVLYLAEQDTNDVWELYSVPAAGGVPVKINAELTFRWRCALVWISVQPGWITCALPRRSGYG